eukprot:UN12243
MDLCHTNASREHVIGVAAYFIYTTDSTAVVLAAVNYSDHLLLCVLNSYQMVS